MFGQMKDLPTAKSNQFLWPESINAIGYDNLINLKDIVTVSKTFYFIFHPASRFSNTLGWKLHLSIAPTSPDEIKKAFNLAAPIILNYSKAFKVINVDYFNDEDNKEKNARTYQGCQITITLEEDGKPVITVSECTDMINKITRLFIANDIKPGQIPISDKKTISDFFSLRNDKSYQNDYIKAQLVGSNFNPCNSYNYFQGILPNKPMFNLVDHYHNFNNELSIKDRIIFCLNGILNESINPQIKPELLNESVFTEQMFFLPIITDNQVDLFKNEDKDRVLLAGRLFSWILSPESDLNDQQKIALLYQHHDEFKKFLILCDEFFFNNPNKEKEIQLYNNFTFKGYVINQMEKQFKKYIDSEYGMILSSDSDEEAIGKKQSLKEFLIQTIDKQNGTLVICAMKELLWGDLRLKSDDVLRLLKPFDKKPEVQFILSIYYQTILNNQGKAKEYLMDSILGGALNYISYKKFLGETGSLFDHVMTVFDKDDIKKLTDANSNFGKLLTAMIYGEEITNYNIIPNPQISIHYLKEILNDDKEADSDLIQFAKNGLNTYAETLSTRPPQQKKS